MGPLRASFMQLAFRVTPMRCVPLFSLAAFLLSPSALAAAPTGEIGSTVLVVNRVTAEYERDQRDLKRGDRVHEDETVEVGQDAVGELRLDDDTKLALGAGSRLKLDKFVYNAKKNNGEILLELAKGTFRFITGTADKPTYKIKTPTASITVRGTIFDMFVQEDGMTWLLLHEGAVRVCNDSGVCRLLDRPGMLIRITERGDVGKPTRWTSLPGRDRVGFDTAFPFVAVPPGIDPKPPLTRDVIINGRLPAPKAPAPTRRTETDKPSKKPTRQAEDVGSRTKKPTKTASEPPPKPKRTQRAEVDSAPFIPPSISIGIGIGGFGKIGGGGGGGGRYPGGSGPMRTPKTGPILTPNTDMPLKPSMPR
jgi:hypothetical protein